MVTITGITTDRAKELLAQLFAGEIDTLVPLSLGIGADGTVSTEDSTWTDIPGLVYTKAITNSSSNITDTILQLNLDGQNIPDNDYNIVGIYNNSDLLFVAVLDTPITITDTKFIEIEWKIEW